MSEENYSPNRLYEIIKKQPVDLGELREEIRFFLDSKDRIAPINYRYIISECISITIQNIGINALELLLDKGFPVNEIGNQGLTPLMEAAQLSSPKKVRLLLERGATANTQTHKGETALSLTKNPEIRSLLQRKVYEDKPAYRLLAKLEARQQINPNWGNNIAVAVAKKVLHLTP